MELSSACLEEMRRRLGQRDKDFDPRLLEISNYAANQPEYLQRELRKLQIEYNLKNSAKSNQSVTSPKHSERGAQLRDLQLLQQSAEAHSSESFNSIKQRLNLRLYDSQYFKQHQGAELELSGRKSDSETPTDDARASQSMNELGVQGQGSENISTCLLEQMSAYKKQIVSLKIEAVSLRKEKAVSGSEVTRLSNENCALLEQKAQLEQQLSRLRCECSTLASSIRQQRCRLERCHAQRRRRRSVGVQVEEQLSDQGHIDSIIEGIIFIIIGLTGMMVFFAMIYSDSTRVNQ